MSRGRVRILVADDSAVIRLMLDDVLSAAGYEVLLADDGDVALAMVECERPDVLLTDLNMPRMHGFALIDALRANPRLDHLPIVVLTSEDSHFKRIQAQGVQAWIVKPFEPAELLETLWSLELAAG